MIVRMPEHRGSDLLEPEVTGDGLVSLRRVVFDRDSRGQPVPRRIASIKPPRSGSTP